VTTPSPYLIIIIIYDVPAALLLLLLGCCQSLQVLLVPLWSLNEFTRVRKSEKANHTG
jgi:hypothetical protein